MADHGLDLLELEFLMEWFLDPCDERRVESDRTRGCSGRRPPRSAHHVKVGNIPGTPCEIAGSRSAFAELCEDAARANDVPVVYEFMPFDVNVQDARHGAGGGRGRRRGQRRPGDRHVAHGQARDPARRTCGGSRSSTCRWVELSDGRFEDMADSSTRP